MVEDELDLVIIGSGRGGYVAAIIPPLTLGDSSSLRCFIIGSGCSHLVSFSLRHFLRVRSPERMMLERFGEKYR